MGWSKVGGSSFEGNGDDECVFCDKESCLTKSSNVCLVVVCM